MKTLPKLVGGILVSLVLIGSAAAPCSEAPAQQGRIPYHKEPYPVHSGLHHGTAARRTVVFRQVVRVAGAPWLRLLFGDHNLGRQSTITITSLKDGGSQRLDAESLAQWGNASAYFNGEAVEVELRVAPEDTGVFFRLEELAIGERDGGVLGPVSICGATDDRIASANDRVGRLLAFANLPGITVCTAWLTSNGALLTAGHCVDWDPDEGGPLLPDGVLDLIAGDVVEFDVPASSASGGINFANPNDQYPIDVNSVEWHFDGSGQGLGKDWAIFATGANANTGLLPHAAQGVFFRMTRESPSVGATIRVTGFGYDDDPPGTTGFGNADSYTQQTHTGPYVGESSSGADFWHEHQVDTAGASSGSPIIWNSNGLVIGIHTNAGCGVLSGANAGTSFEHNPLEDAIQDFPGPNTVYVDKVSAAPTENGTVFQPYDTVLEAAGAVPAGGIVSIVAGSYDEHITINRAATLMAPVGTVTIGQ